MLDPAAMPRVQPFLRADHFWHEAHRRVYEAAMYLAERSEPVDTTTIMARLNATGRLKQVGGAEAIVDMMGASPAVANVEAHGHVVLERWREREAIRIMREAAAKPYVGQVEDTQAYLDDVVHRLDVLARSGPHRAGERNEHALARILKDIHDRGTSGGKRRGLPSGFPAVDAMSGGLHAGRKTTIGAHTGRGKTTISVNLAINVALQGIGVVPFITEITRDEWLEMAIAILARVDTKRLAAGNLTADEAQHVATAAERLSKLPIEIVHDPELTVERVRTVTHQMVERFPRMHGAPLGVEIVDHVHRLSAPQGAKFRDRMALVNDATKKLKTLAQVTRTCVVELAQLKSQSREDMKAKPELGSIMFPEVEREADDVWYLHRPAAQKGVRREHGVPVPLTLIVAKARFGETGETELAWYRDQGRIVDEALPPPMAMAPRFAQDLLGEDDDA
jgi:replicative DNA helicase